MCALESLQLVAFGYRWFSLFSSLLSKVRETCVSPITFTHNLLSPSLKKRKHNGALNGKAQNDPTFFRLAGLSSQLCTNMYYLNLGRCKISWNEFCLPIFTELSWMSTFLNITSTIFYQKCTIFNLWSTILNFTSTISSLKFTIFNLKSTIFN